MNQWKGYVEYVTWISQALLKNIHQMSFGVAGTKRKCRHYDVEEDGAGSGQNPGRS